MNQEIQIKKKPKIEDMKAYQKDYYQVHKQKMMGQVKISYKNRSLVQLVDKLNNKGSFIRFPYNRIKKYGINFDTDTGIFSI